MSGKRQLTCAPHTNKVDVQGKVWGVASPGGRAWPMIQTLATNRERSYAFDCRIRRTPRPPTPSGPARIYRAKQLRRRARGCFVFMPCRFRNPHPPAWRWQANQNMIAIDDRNWPPLHPHAVRLLQAATAAGSGNPRPAASAQYPPAARATSTACALGRPRFVHLALSSLSSHS